MEVGSGRVLILDSTNERGIKSEIGCLTCVIKNVKMRESEGYGP